MRRTIQKSIRSLFIFSVITGIVYPLTVTFIAQWIAPHQANGSLLRLNGTLIGSELIGQKFTKPNYFWGRPSASDYQTLPSSASNLGPTSQKLKDRVLKDMKALQVEASTPQKPYDLLLSSGSGLDPDITPQSARRQKERIAKERRLTSPQVQEIIDNNTQYPYMGLFGRPRVNVLKLNLALDSLNKR